MHFLENTHFITFITQESEQAFAMPSTKEDYKKPF
jgi:hypothetical protein